MSLLTVIIVSLSKIMLQNVSIFLNLSTTFLGLSLLLSSFFKKYKQLHEKRYKFGIDGTKISPANLFPGIYHLCTFYKAYILVLAIQEDADQTARMRRLVRVFAAQQAQVVRFPKQGAVMFPQGVCQTKICINECKLQRDEIPIMWS